MKKIFLLTGPKNSGKSTRLMNWILHETNVTGIVCPRSKGKRELYSVHTKNYKEFEVDNDSNPVVKIGNYKFLKESFEWAEKELLKAREFKPQWLVIDEIGPLELQGQGFDKVIKQLLNLSELSETNFVLVVRENLIDDVISNYNLDADKIETADFI